MSELSTDSTETMSFKEEGHKQSGAHFNASSLAYMKRSVIFLTGMTMPGSHSGSLGCKERFSEEPDLAL